MAKLFTFFALLMLGQLAAAQVNQTYTRSNGSRHLMGEVTIDLLEKDTLFSEWFQNSYNEQLLTSEKTSWAKKLSDTQVTIYFGSWCGDSKYYVPRFIKLWDKLGLDRSQLTLIALYDGQEPGRYKQGPNQEEKDKYIHRVPTFIFEEEGKETARIVEYPVNDLETDIAQIALGYPSQPSYRGANFLMQAFDNYTLEDLRKNKTNVKYHVRRQTKSNRELNTLGYVLIAADKLEEAEYVFDLNRELYPHHANTHDSYAEVLATLGKNELAIANYQKVLLLDPDNENAVEQIKRLETALQEAESD